MQEIYKITPEILENKVYFQEVMVPNLENNYYWSNNWSEAFYVTLAKLGFISTTYETPEGLILLPELQFSYAVLFFENLHISKKVKKLLKKDEFELVWNRQFDSVLDKFEEYHKYNWIEGEYKTLMKKLHRSHFENFSLCSVELIAKESQELVAAEIGYVIGKTYTSLSGFSSKEKHYANCGTLQLVLLAKDLQKRGFSFWNLGHPHMEYKKRLGVTVLERESFLTLWQKESSLY